MHRGYVKLWRKMCEWEWYQDSQTFHLFMHLLLKANTKDSKFQGFTIKRGEIITGREKLSFETGISIQSVRTCLERLSNSKVVTIKSTSKYSIVTICNYETYQPQQIEDNQQNDDASTSNQPATNHQSTTSKEFINNEKNNISSFSESQTIGDINLFGDLNVKPAKSRKFIKPTVEEIAVYCNERNNAINPQHFYDYYEARGWSINKSPMKDWKASVRTWEHNNKSNFNSKPLNTPAKKELVM